jgi:hypothetical protein
MCPMDWGLPGARTTISMLVVSLADFAVRAQK